MATLTIGDQKVTVDDSFLKLSPEQQSATVEEIASSLPKAAPKTSGVMDFFKSIPRGVIGGLSSAGSALGQATAHEMSQPGMAAEIPGQEQTTQALEKNVTGSLPQPQGRAGKFGAAIGESLGNPASYIGPGGLPLKVGGAILSAAGSEGAGQATEGTAYEWPARIAGALAGGVAAAKGLGPTTPKAATPAAAELKASAVSGGEHGGYNAALNSGLELDPKGVAGWSQQVRQGLFNDGLTGGTHGTAPKTWAALDSLDKPTSGVVTPQGIDALRKTLGRVSREVQQTQGGAIVATEDAAAASQALKKLGSYVENIPQSHILAGDAALYANATKEANKNYASYARVRDFEARLEKANLAAQGQIAGSVENQTKAKARQVLNNGARGYDDAERAQAKLINSGGPVSNILRNLGRAGAGVVPALAHGAIAAGTGGASLGLQIPIAAALYGARKTSEAITKSRANKLVEMLAQRSPEYQSRVANLPQVSNAPNKAAIIRALLAAH